MWVPRTPGADSRSFAKEFEKVLRRLEGVVGYISLEAWLLSISLPALDACLVLVCTSNRATPKAGMVLYVCLDFTAWLPLYFSAWGRLSLLCHV